MNNQPTRLKPAPQKQCTGRTKKSLLTYLLGAGVCLYVLSRFIPTESATDASQAGDLDFGWALALHRAFSSDWQFGRDIVFSFGPWGFLASGYNPETYLVSATIWFVFSIVWVVASWRLVMSFRQNQAPGYVWIIAFTAASSIPIQNDFNIIPAAWSILLVMVYFFVERDSTVVIQGLLASFLALMGLVKFNALVSGAVIMAIIGLDSIFRARRFPWVPVIWFLSLLLYWSAAGQQFDNFGLFLLNSYRVAEGYTEAMLLPDKAEWPMVVGYLVMAGLLLTLLWRKAWLEFRWFALLPTAAIFSLLFFVFKMGYVRNGSEHASSSAMVLLLVSLGLVAVIRSEQKGLRIASLAIFSVAGLFAGTVISHWSPGFGLVSQFAQTLRPTRLFAPVAASATGYLRDEYVHYMDRKRTETKLPHLNGTVDLYSYDQAFLFANQLYYKPRPVIQSYSAYTPELAKINASHLRSSNTADNILFAIQPIDGRHPALEDGLSWPELLTRYEIQNGTVNQGKFLLLTRAAHPKKFWLTPLKTLNSQIGARIDLPDADRALIWAEIEIKASLIGKLAIAAYKPPILNIEATQKNGLTHHYRFVPKMGAAGFLLSPLIADNQSFAQLTNEENRGGLTDLKAIRITSASNSEELVNLCYNQTISVQFYRLEFSGDKM